MLFLSGHVAPDRADAFALLHERAGIELALFGGRNIHAAPPEPPPAGLPHRFVSQAQVSGLVASGDYRAVIAGTGLAVTIVGDVVANRRSRQAVAELAHQRSLYRARLVEALGTEQGSVPP